MHQKSPTIISRRETPKRTSKAYQQPQGIIKSAEKMTIKCRTTGLYTLVRKMSPHQKELVKEIGFDGLLHMNISSIPSAIAHRVLEAFDSKKKIFRVSKSKHFQLSKEDVFDVFAIPKGPEKIVLSETGLHAKSEDSKRLKTMWRKKFQIQDSRKGILLQNLCEKLTNGSVEDDDFKRMFVLYVMSYFLAPTSNHLMDLRLVLAVDDVSRIKQLDWCSFVFEELVIATKDWKEKKSTYVRGCLLFLIISYFHRLIPPDEQMVHEIPLIKHWTDEKFAARVRHELELGGWGRGVSSNVGFPICLSLPKEGMRPDHMLCDELQTQAVDRARPLEELSLNRELLDLRDKELTQERQLLDLRDKELTQERQRLDLRDKELTQERQLAAQLKSQLEEQSATTATMAEVLRSKVEMEAVFALETLAKREGPESQDEIQTIGRDGDLCLYPERLANAKNVQKFIRENPRGQEPITKTNPSRSFYSKVAKGALHSSSQGCVMANVCLDESPSDTQTPKPSPAHRITGKRKRFEKPDTHPCVLKKK